MFFNPGFHFSAIIAAITQKAGYMLDPVKKINVKGPGFKWEDWITTETGIIFGKEYRTPSPCESWAYIWLLC